jgi:hypothetical protein
LAETLSSPYPFPHQDYLAVLDADALKGKRIGVLRVMFGSKPEHSSDRSLSTVKSTR